MQKTKHPLAVYLGILKVELKKLASIQQTHAVKESDVNFYYNGDKLCGFNSGTQNTVGYSISKSCGILCSIHSLNCPTLINYKAQLMLVILCPEGLPFSEFEQHTGVVNLQVFNGTPQAEENLQRSFHQLHADPSLSDLLGDQVVQQIVEAKHPL